MVGRSSSRTSPLGTYLPATVAVAASCGASTALIRSWPRWR